MKMAQINSGLRDIELPPDGISTGLVVLGLVLILSLLSLLIWFYHKYQQPLKRARRQLLALTEKTLEADRISQILCEGLQVRQLKNSALPEDFIQRLQYARFSSGVFDTDTLLAIKNEALLLLTRLEKSQFQPEKIKA
jgi:hypothetical protein